jgi:hypothetical protein
MSEHKPRPPKNKLPIDFTVTIRWPVEVLCSGTYDAENLELDEITSATIILEDHETQPVRPRDIWAECADVDDEAHAAAAEQHPYYFRDEKSEPAAWPYSGVVIAHRDEHVQALGRALDLAAEIDSPSREDLAMADQLSRLLKILTLEKDAHDGTVAVRVPDHPMIVELLQQLGRAFTPEALDDPKRAAYMRNLLDMMKET